MLGFLDLRRPCLARSLAKLASLARVEADLAWRLFGKRSLLGLPGVSPWFTLVLEQILGK